MTGTCVCGFERALGSRELFDHLGTCPEAKRQTLRDFDRTFEKLKDACEDSLETEATLP